MHAVLIINFTSFHNSQKHTGVTERLEWIRDTSCTHPAWQIRALKVCGSCCETKAMRSPARPHLDSQDTHVILFWCRVSRVVLRSSVVALLSIFRKRSMAEMLRWMLCFGMSSFETKVSKPRSSQLKSMGQQSWPCNHTPGEHVKTQSFSCSAVVNCRTVTLDTMEMLLIANLSTHGAFLTLQNTTTLY